MDPIANLLCSDCKWKIRDWSSLKFMSLKELEELFSGKKMRLSSSANDDRCRKLEELLYKYTKQKFYGVTKGLVAEKIFTSMCENGKQADFVLCIGDDRSDEDMFEIIGSAISGNILSSNTSVFACTVGQKPSKAKYYLDDTSEVIQMLENLAEATDSPASSDVEDDVSP